MSRQKVPYKASVLVLKEKHSDVYFDALTEEALHRSALSILRGRVQNHWYDDEFLLRARLVIQRKQGEKAWEMLRERQDYEHEGLSCEPIMTKYPTYGDQSDD